MVLLSSSAHHIYWLGRYLFRISYMAEHLHADGINDDHQAAKFAQALCLRIEDSETLYQFMLDRQQPYSLMSQLEIARDNIQELRGLLTSNAYAQMNDLIKHAEAEALQIHHIVTECASIMQQEQQDIALFFQIGQMVEKIDLYFRFQQNIPELLDTTDSFIDQLFQLGWKDDLQASWDVLKHQPCLNQFYGFTYKLENHFKRNA